MKGEAVNTSEFSLNLTCIYFTGGGIKLLVSAEAEEAAHEGVRRLHRPFLLRV